MSKVSRITVLISGNGTNLQALIDAINDGKLSATIVRVVSNRKAAFGLDRARESGIPTTYHNLLNYKNQHPKTNEGVQVAREKYDRDLAQLVLEDKPDLVACLGFMHVVSQKFLDPLNEARVKIINLHPALPGRFNGTVSRTSLYSILTHMRFRSSPSSTECFGASTYRLERRQDRQNRSHDTRSYCRSRHGCAHPCPRDLL